MNMITITFSFSYNGAGEPAANHDFPPSKNYDLETSRRMFAAKAAVAVQWQPPSLYIWDSWYQIHDPGKYEEQKVRRKLAFLYFYPINVRNVKVIVRSHFKLYFNLQLVKQWLHLMLYAFHKNFLSNFSFRCPSFLLDRVGS